MSKDGFVQFIEDQLSLIGNVYSHRMFGGHGLYYDDVFFGIIYREQLYFKTDEQTRLVYIDKNMKPFQPRSDQVLKNYYEVPPDHLEDQDMLVSLAKEAIDCQKKAKGSVKR